MFSLRFAACLLAFSLAAPVAAEPLAHMVFFTLADDNQTNREELANLCQEYLDGHEGVLYFSVGVLAEKHQREVNDRAFDVSLHMVFDGVDSHDLYQDHPRHHEFIKKMKPLLSSVRVFDSYLKTPAGAPKKASHGG